MNSAVVYTDGNQECERVTQLLKSLGGEYIEYYLGQDFTDKEFQKEFGPAAPYPQITINGEHVGSLKDTLHYFQDKGEF